MSEGLIDRLMEWSMKWVMGPFFILFVVALACGMFLGIPYGIYRYITYTPPEYFELRVDSWQCTKSFERDRQVCSKGCRWVREAVCERYEAK